VYPGRQQRLQRQHRVAQPAVAVIPVAHAADVLRQRCRRRCDHRTSRLVGHRLERDQRAQHRLPIRALISAAPAPLSPPRLGSCERRVGILDRRSLLVGQMPGQHEALASSLDRNKLSTHCAVLDVERQRSAQTERVRSGRNHDPVRGQLNPRHDRPVVRTQRQLHPHRHPTPHALHDPHQPRRPIAPFGHEVDHAHPAVRSLEIALEHKRARPVTTRARAHLIRRGQQPATVPLMAHQCREARRRIKSRQTQPVDRPVTTDQSSGLQVTDQPIVLDTHTCLAGR